MTTFSATEQPRAVSSTPEQEERLYQKVILRLVPFLFIFYVFDYLDRVNISFAKLEMLGDLHWSDTVYGLGAGMFFIGYFVFEVPGNLILHKFGARRWLAFIMGSWGLISAAMMFVTSPASFYQMRFLLGLAEAGFFPGVILYLTYWFPQKRRGGVMALFVAAIGFCGIIGGPISGCILHFFNGVAGLAGWKWLLLIEGMPSILLAFVAWVVLDDSIRVARWLSDEEKELLERNLAKESRAGHHIPVWKVAFQWRVWLLSLVLFCLMIGLYGIGFWLPQIIKNTGVTDIIQVGLLSAIPYGVAMFVMVWVARHSDRMNERRWHLTIPAFAGALGLILCGIYRDNTLMAMAALTLASAGVLTTVPISQTLPMEFLSGMGVAAGIGMINSLGNLGGFVSPYMVGAIKDHTQSTSYGLYAIAACLVVGGVLVHAVRAEKVHDT